MQGKTQHLSMYHCCLYFHPSILKYLFIIYCLPWGLNGKEDTWQCRRHRFDPWVRKTPWRKKWQPTPVFLPGKSHGQRSLAGWSPRGPWAWMHCLLAQTRTANSAGFNQFTVPIPRLGSSLNPQRVPEGTGASLQGARSYLQVPYPQPPQPKGTGGSLLQKETMAGVTSTLQNPTRIRVPLTFHIKLHLCWISCLP